MTQIPKGGNLPIPTEPLHIAVCWGTGPGLPDADISALLLDAGGKVRGDADLVFYNQTTHPSQAVQHLGKSDGDAGARADWLVLEPARVEPEVQRIVVAASADGGTFGRIPGLHIRVSTAAGAQVAYFPVTDAGTETAFLFGEFYRRDGGWKFRAVGQGYASGLAGLATDFGVHVEQPVEQPQDAVPPPPTAAPVQDLPSFAPAEQRGRGNQTVTLGPLPPGRVIIEIECRFEIGAAISSCDQYGRTDDTLLSHYYGGDRLHGRTTARVPHDRPLTLRVEVDGPWTVRALPLHAARRLTDTPVQGQGPDVLRYEGPDRVGEFGHRGDNNFAVWHIAEDPGFPGHDDETLLVNEIGRLQVGAPLPGPGLLRIEADGPWTSALRR